RFIIDKINTINPDADNKWVLGLVKRKLSSKYRRIKNSKSFHGLSRKVQAYYLNDRKVPTIQNAEKYIQSLTFNDIRETAEKHLKINNMMEFVYKDSVK